MKKLSQITNNKEWRKNRNLHAVCLADMMLNNILEEPYNKFSPDGSIPIISKILVKSKLSNKFHEFMQNINNLNQGGTRENFLNENDGTDLFNEDEVLPRIDKKKNVNNFKNTKNSNFNKSGVLPDLTLDQLRLTIENLKNELKLRDDIIERQKEDKKRMENRIMELQKIIDTLVNKK